jgi:hypothetical protein
MREERDWRGGAGLPVSHLRVEHGGSAARSTFMRMIAPSHEASKNSARSWGANVRAISPAAWPSGMQAANGARHSAKRVRNISLCGAASRLKSPISSRGGTDLEQAGQ